MATISCDPGDLMEAAKCLDKCIPRGMHPYIQIYLLQQIAESTLTVDELLNAAKCFQKCIPPEMMDQVHIYLMCQIINSE
jgi:hypothetical protein